MKNTTRIAGAIAVLLLGINVSFSETWSQFRGATGSGVSSEKNLPVRWSKDKGVKWVTPLPGRANSSPAVTSKRIDLTTQLSDNSLVVISIDRASGKIIREVKVGQGTLAAKGPKNLYGHRHNSATPSPVADENNIWAFFGTGLLICLDAKTGNTVWKRDLAKDFGAYDITFGMGASPRLNGNLLYIACMTKGPSYVLALDKRTGDRVWKTTRRLPAKDDGPDAYSSPVVYTTPGRDQLLIAGSDHINAYDLITGKQIWVSGGLKIKSPYGRVIASPVVSNGIVVATAANPGGAGLGRVIAVRGNGKNDISESHRLWDYSQSTPDSSTPVALGGRVYLLSDNGIVSSLNIKTGQRIWRKRLSKGPYHASLVVGDGKIYCLSSTGTCDVIKTSASAETLATNQLEGSFYATPAISGGTLYLRAYERIYAIDGD